MSKLIYVVGEQNPMSLPKGKVTVTMTFTVVFEMDASEYEGIREFVHQNEAPMCDGGFTRGEIADTIRHRETEIVDRSVLMVESK